MDLIDDESFGFCCPPFADALIGRQAFERLQSSPEIIGADEVGEMLLSKQKIIDRMFSYDADIQLDAIEVIAHRLRTKLGDDMHIRTLGGLGYVLEVEPV